MSDTLDKLLDAVEAAIVADDTASGPMSGYVTHQFDRVTEGTGATGKDGPAFPYLVLRSEPGTMLAMSRASEIWEHVLEFVSYATSRGAASNFNAVIMDFFGDEAFSLGAIGLDLGDCDLTACRGVSQNVSREDTQVFAGSVRYQFHVRKPRN